MKIHAIQTGTVSVTSAWREGVGHGRRRLLTTILDREWTGPLPIYAVANEHPEGVIVVDTGETARASRPGSFPAGTRASAPSASRSSPSRRSAPSCKVSVPLPGHTPRRAAARPHGPGEGGSMITFDAGVRIERPIEEVFAYVSDPDNLPHWNSAVRAVEKTSTGQIEVGSTYSIERELPTGRAANELEIVARDRPTEFAIRTTSGPTPFLYRFRLSPERGGTVVQLDAVVELHGAGFLVAQLARRAVKKGVEDNLAALGQILEASPLRGLPGPLTGSARLQREEQGSRRPDKRVGPSSRSPDIPRPHR